MQKMEKYEIEPSISVVQNNACFIGAFTSILNDCYFSDEIKEAILVKLKHNTKGNVTSIKPSNIDEYTSNFLFVNILYYFRDFKEIIENQIEIDNKNSFALLFWYVDFEGNSQHVTRFISFENNQIKLMEPTSGEIKYFDFLELQNISPKGFAFVVLIRV